MTGLIAVAAGPEPGRPVFPDNPNPAVLREFGAEFVVEWQVAEHPEHPGTPTAAPHESPG